MGSSSRSSGQYGNSAMALQTPHVSLKKMLRFIFATTVSIVLSIIVDSTSINIE